MVNKLKNFLQELRALRKDIKSEKVRQIAKKALRIRAEKLGTLWFRELSNPLEHEQGIAPEILDKYQKGCGRLIELSSFNNLKSSYLGILDDLIKPFRKDLILIAQKGRSSSASLALLDKLLNTLPDPDEDEYLRDAVRCAQRGFFRAAIILGWCAAIDRIHRCIAERGFTHFNVTSAKMASQKVGRFKRFNQPQNVSSLSELREVFDTTVLRVIEGMSLIDGNQYTRLKSCFDMRCQCSHPGEAPITEYNLMSFFSDLNQIVLVNENFKLA